mgnify:CR=1 FL=1
MYITLNVIKKHTCLIQFEILIGIQTVLMITLDHQGKIALL